MRLLIQVSDHPGAIERPCSEEAGESWKWVYDGPYISLANAAAMVLSLKGEHKFAHAFRENKSGLGRLILEADSNGVRRA